MKYGRSLKTLLLCSLLAAAMALPACSQNPAPNVTPEARVAIYVRQALTIADGVLGELDKVTELRLANAKTDPDRERIKAQARAVAGVLKEVGEYGQQLGDALRIWSATRQALNDQTAAAGRVRAILVAVQQLLPRVTAPIDDPNIRVTLGQALQVVSDLLLNVGALVPAPVAP